MLSFQILYHSKWSRKIEKNQERLLHIKQGKAIPLQAWTSILFSNITLHTQLYIYV